MFTVSNPSIVISALQEQHTRVMARLNELGQILLVAVDALSNSEMLSKDRYDAWVRQEMLAKDEVELLEATLSALDAQLLELGDQMDEAWMRQQFAGEDACRPGCECESEAVPF